MVKKKYSEKATSPIMSKMKKKKETRVAFGAPAYRRTVQRRAAASKVTPEKDVMASANQTSGG